MKDASRNIIGTGWSFPPRFDKNTETVSMVTGEEDIVQSLTILFGTQLGERILEQDYGCQIASFLFRPITPAVSSVLRNQIRRAITLHEARIKIEEITLDTSEAVDGKINIQLQWLEESTNNRRNIVFPFYASEGTLIPSKS